MTRVKTFVATGVATDGKIYAGDLNAIQDQYADLTNLAQTVGVGTLHVGEAGLGLLRYGAGEGRLTGAFRVDALVRALGGLYIGAFTTTQRDAIPATGTVVGGIPHQGAPYGIVILNTTTNRYEWNSGNDTVRVWRPIAFNGSGILAFPDGTTQSTAYGGAAATSGLLSARAAAGAGNDGKMYYATDQISIWLGVASAWVRIGPAQCGDIIWTNEAVARPGHILMQGQAWPSTTGIYAELWAKWGGANVPDAQARAFYALGTHALVDTLLDNDGVAAVANRPGPRHRHTPHTHSPASGGNFLSDLNNSWVGVSGGGGVGIALNAVSTVDGGSGVGSDPLDGGAFLVLQPQAKL